MSEMKLNIPAEVISVIRRLNAAGFEAYIVGGCVRDLLLRKSPKDWDVTTSAKPEDILKLFEEAKRTFGAQIVKIKQEKVEDISLFSVSPHLTSQQKTAVELAVRSGYYDYPRKIKLEELAKMMKISYSTFQEHLRKAEQKLLPYYAKVGHVTDKTDK